MSNQHQNPVDITKVIVLIRNQTIPCKWDSKSVGFSTIYSFDRRRFNLHLVTGNSSTIHYLCPFSTSGWASAPTNCSSNSPTSSLLTKILPSTLPQNKNCSSGWRAIAVIASGYTWDCISLPETKSQTYEIRNLVSYSKKKIQCRKI